MRDYSHMFPVEPILGWVTENHNDRAVDGEVQQVQGFKGYVKDGTALADLPWVYDKEMIWVPECGYHTSEKFFPTDPLPAIVRAQQKADELRAKADRIEASIDRVFDA
jgi:hypothetical protein